jgi:diguanylate cyclase (GGDEF)-like protein
MKGCREKHAIAEQNTEIPVTVLIVDDNESLNRLIQRKLEREGFLTEQALNGAVAIAKVVENRDMIMVLDHLLPDMKGEQVINRLFERKCEIPFIIMTGHGDEQIAANMMKLGARDYLVKVADFIELLPRVVKQVVEQVATEKKLAKAEETLRQRNRELAMLNHASDMFQACRTERELYSVVIEEFKQLFPSDSGCLCMMDKFQTMLKVVASWGNCLTESQACSVDKCWALSFDKVHVVEPLCTGLLCPHLGNFPDYGCLCAPIRISGKILGILSLYFGPCAPDSSDNGYKRMVASKRIVVNSFLRHYTLSLVNLRLRETLRMKSIRDPLTGLYNRRYMEESLERETHRANRHKTSAGIIMIDIDYFKPFNDTYGHEVGDKILRALGAFLRRHSRGEDITCRYGGEEFLLILPEASLEVTKCRAEELCSRTKEIGLEYRGRSLNITISLGVAALPNHGPSVKDAVNAADKALYRAKNKGRNQVMVAAPLFNQSKWDVGKNTWRGSHGRS